MSDIKQLLYWIANEIYWKSFIDKGFWIFVAFTILITEVLFAFILPESKAYLYGAKFSLEYFLWFFGIMTVTLYPTIHWWTNRRKRQG